MTDNPSSRKYIGKDEKEIDEDLEKIRKDLLLMNNHIDKYIKELLNDKNFVREKHAIHRTRK